MDYQSPYEGGLVNSWQAHVEMSYRVDGHSFFTLWCARVPNEAKYSPDRVRVHVGREYARPTSFPSFVHENNYHLGR